VTEDGRPGPAPDAASAGPVRSKREGELVLKRSVVLTSILLLCLGTLALAQSPGPPLPHVSHNAGERTTIRAAVREKFAVMEWEHFHIGWPSPSAYGCASTWVNGFATDKDSVTYEAADTSDHRLTSVGRGFMSAFESIPLHIGSDACLVLLGGYGPDSKRRFISETGSTEVWYGARARTDQQPVTIWFRSEGTHWVITEWIQ